MLTFDTSHMFRETTIFCSLMFDNNCCLCYMHRSKSFAIIIRPHPNLAYHSHGPSKSTPAICSVKIQVRQNPPLRFGPSKSRSVKIHPRDLVGQNPVLQIPGPANLVTPLKLAVAYIYDSLITVLHHRWTRLRVLPNYANIYIVAGSYKLYRMAH